MSRFSPTVQPNSGEVFARALGQGVNSYLSSRQQKREDDRQAKQDALAATEHQRVIAREGQQDQLAQALGASQLRDRGFVPDAERGPNERVLASGDELNGAISAATGPQFAAALGQPDARAPRYGASTGGYSYDYAGPQAQAQGAKLAEQLAQTEKLRRPAPPTAPLMGSPEWKASQEFVAGLGRQSHQADRAYDAAHPLKDPQQGGLPPAQANTVKLQQSALLNMNKAVAELQKAVKKHGMTIRPGADRGEMEALQANAMIQFKEAANLGALSGPDMGLVEGALGKATSPMQWSRGGADGVLSALKAAQQSLDARARTMETVYGVKMPTPILIEPPNDVAAPPTMAPSSRAPLSLRDAVPSPRGRAPTQGDPVLDKYGLTPRAP